MISSTNEQKFQHNLEVRQVKIQIIHIHGRTLSDTYSPLKISGASIPNRCRNSEKVIWVGYPEHFILIASRTP